MCFLRRLVDLVHVRLSLARKNVNAALRHNCHYRVNVAKSPPIGRQPLRCRCYSQPASQPASARHLWTGHKLFSVGWHCHQPAAGQRWWHRVVTSQAWTTAPFHAPLTARRIHRETERETELQVSLALGRVGDGWRSVTLTDHTAGVLLTDRVDLRRSVTTTHANWRL